MSSQRTRIAVAGLDHDHVFWIFRKLERPDVEFVGFYDSNIELAKRYASRFGLAPNLMFNDLNTMLDTVQPQGVVAFSSIFHHLEAVEICAPRGIHVMVEKPLAVSMEHARKMEALTKQHGIHLLTNYETTWYPTNHEVHRMVQAGQLGTIRKVHVRDGHHGPVEIGCTPEFLAWLTDPVLNGGGAVIDFGCYGANLATWLMNNQRPQSVTGILQTHKPDVYPKVDDDTTIILTYPGTQVVIQGSWNWTVGRKDMEVYGQTGYTHAVNRTTLTYRLSRTEPEQTVTLDERPAPHNDPFSYFAAVIRGEIVMDEYDLYGLPNNMIAVEILDAARESAKTGQRITLT
jgi:predicted dehydrogenase